MKKICFVALGLFAVTLPAVSQAAPVCFKDNFVNATTGNFYSLDIKPACKPTSSKNSAITGKMFFVNPEADCGAGIAVRPVTGVCFGAPILGKVVVGLQIIAEGPGCSSANLLFTGPSTADAGSGTLRFDGSTSTAVTLTPVPCSDNPSPL